MRKYGEVLGLALFLAIWGGPLWLEPVFAQDHTHTREQWAGIFKLAQDGRRMATQDKCGPDVARKAVGDTIAALNGDDFWGLAAAYKPHGADLKQAVNELRRRNPNVRVDSLGPDKLIARLKPCDLIIGLRKIMGLGDPDSSHVGRVQVQRRDIGQVVRKGERVYFRLEGYAKAGNKLGPFDHPKPEWFVYPRAAARINKFGVLTVRQAGGQFQVSARVSGVWSDPVIIHVHPAAPWWAIGTYLFPLSLPILIFLVVRRGGSSMARIQRWHDDPYSEDSGAAAGPSTGNKVPAGK